MNGPGRDRLPVLDESVLTPAQRKVYDSIVTGPRGDVVGPLRVWLQSPDMADRAQALGQYARFDSTLPSVLSELAILVTARIWSAEMEWAHHAPLAEAAGLAPAVIDAIARARMPRFADPAQAAVFAYAVELHRDRAVTQPTFDAAGASLGTRGLVDLTAICGYYTLISMTIVAFDVPKGSGPHLPATPLPPQDMFRDPA